MLTFDIVSVKFLTHDLGCAAKQKVMALPATAREVTLTSQKTTTVSSVSKTQHEVTPVFVQPLKPEVRIREHTTARYVYTQTGDLLNCLRCDLEHRAEMKLHHRIMLCAVSLLHIRWCQSSSVLHLLVSSSWFEGGLDDTSL